MIDVHDPAQPAACSRRYSTWARGLWSFSAPPPRRGGIGHTATCIQQCRYAWLAGSPAGIDIVDLRDPAHPRRAGPLRRARGGRDLRHARRPGRRLRLAWVAGGNGTAAYDVTDPVHPRLVKRTDRRARAAPLNDFIHHNSQRLAPGVLAITEEDFGDGCRGAGTLQTWRIGRRAPAAPAGLVRRRARSAARVACSAHYFDAPRRADRAGLLRAGRAADRRARPAAAAPGRLLPVAARAVLGRAVRAHRSRPARPSTGSTTRAGSTCWRSTARR